MKNIFQLFGSRFAASQPNLYPSRSIWAFFALLLAISSALVSCKSKAEQETKSVQYPVAVLNEKDTTFYKDVVADLQAVKNVEIRTRIQGFIEEILVDEGAEVKKGQALFRLSSPEYTAENNKASAALEKAVAEENASRLEMERIKQLVDKKVIANSELQIAQSKLQVAQANVSEAKAVLKNAHAFLAFTTITAPFSGILDRIPLKVGSLVNEGALLTNISDVTNMFAYFHLSENEYLKYKMAKQRGDTIHDEKNICLYLSDGSLYDCRGQVESVAGQIDKSTGNIAFRAKYSNPKKLLRHGSTGSIRLKTDAMHVLMVPVKAVTEMQDKYFVYVVDEQNKVKMESFIPSHRIGNWFVVGSGLKKQQRIVVEGTQSLREGSVITPSLVSLN